MTRYKVKVNVTSAWKPLNSNRWSVLHVTNFLSAFFGCVDPPLQSGDPISHSLISASISASVALGKACDWRVYIIIIISSSLHLNWLISHKIRDPDVRDLHFSEKVDHIWLTSLPQSDILPGFHQCIVTFMWIKRCGIWIQKGPLSHVKSSSLI